MVKKIIVFLVLAILIPGLSAQVLRVNIYGVRNDKGVINLAFFIDNESFQNEEPEFTRIVSKEDQNDGELEVVLNDIPTGKYGIALLDDENEDGEMEYNFLGVPREGFGFSGFYLGGLSKPDFEDFSFEFNDDKTIEIRVRYF